MITFILLISAGYGKLRNLQMVDQILIWCDVHQVEPDIVLFNSAMDAYIRYTFALFFVTFHI